MFDKIDINANPSPIRGSSPLRKSVVGSISDKHASFAADRSIDRQSSQASILEDQIAREHRISESMQNDNEMLRERISYLEKVAS